jgi:hypothetical protein
MIALESNAQLPTSIGSVWPHLDANTVMNRIAVLKSNPNLIKQGSLGLCGEAAFFHHVLKRNPIVFSSMAKLLFMDGWGFVGNLTIHPDSDLRNADYAAIVAAFPTKTIPPQADWMVLSALCDTGNLILDFEGKPDENYADGAYFSQILTWYEKSQLYTLVEKDDDDDLNHIKTNVIKRANNHIMLFIKTAMIHPTSSGRHFITLETPFIIDEANDSVYFDYWTWGNPTSTGAILTVAEFTNNYLGAIVATF